MKREKWVDVCKAIAILAVIINHSSGVLYFSNSLMLLSCLNVSLFIYLMGITQYWSLQRFKGSYLKRTLHAIKRIMVPYIFSVMVFDTVQNRGWDFLRIVRKTFMFDASLPHYYVLLYIQMLIIAPVLYEWVRRISEKGSHQSKLLLVLTGFIIVFLFSVFSIKRTQIMEVYGGAKFLFGGSYLIEFYTGMIIGMLLSNCGNKTPEKKQAYFFLVAGGIGLIGIVCYIIQNGFSLDNRLPFAPGINPPGLILMTYAFLFMMVMRYLINMTQDYTVARVICEPLTRLGKHTLYIFLYHRLFLDFVLPDYDNMILKWIIFPAVMIGGPIIIEYIVQWLMSGMKTLYCRE